ncbi:MAG TPA: FAD-dependent oxidoreductase [bacterium]|nr:FAD-dependent oxidoreductase [bacterium]
MSETLGTPARPLRVAVVGSGPSGFYAAEALFRREGLEVRVDVFDRLPTPYGLVRYGVAPDHQKMKAVIRAYEKTASRPGFRYFGHVELGKDLSVEELHAHYDQIIYAMGAETDKRLGIPGEDLEGSLSSTAFVGWYNGHPNHESLEVDLGCRRVAVIGIGNVAMDVVRVLLRKPEELAETDIADYSLEAIRRSPIREIYLLGRRGAGQAAFTPKEIEEVGKLEGVDLVVDPAQAGEAELEGLEPGTPEYKNVEYLRAKAAEGEGSHERKVRLILLASPVEILGADGRVTGLRYEKNTLVDNGRGGLKAQGTGETAELEVGLVIRAVGYRGLRVPGVPFHEAWGIIPNEEGRVRGEDGSPRTAEYVVGWAKRGPSGLIGTNKGDSAATVEKMIEDLPSTEPAPHGGEDAATIRLLEDRGVEWVSFEDWKLLDRLETERGEARGRVREKILGVEGAMAALREAKAQNA